MTALELEGGVVLYEVNDGVARITMNRPDVLNAINQALRRGLIEALERAEADEEVRAVILTGAGRAFCAGGDLTEQAARAAAPEQASPPQSGSGDTAGLYDRIWTLSKPVIAAVAGHAVGQGCELAGICDITIAAEDARMGEIQVRHGGGPPVLITPYLAGPKQAKEVLLTGDLFDAREAQRIGLVNRVVPTERLQEEAEAFARRIANVPPAAVQRNKRLVNRSFELRGVLAAMHHQADPAYADISSGGVSTPEREEQLRRLREDGWEAFIQERDARYRGEA